MPYLGNIPAARFSAMAKQTITGDGGTAYTLTHAVGNEQEIEVFVNNVRQEPGSGKAYTVSGTTLTMTGNVASTDDFYVVYQGKAQQTATHPPTFPLTATTGTFTGGLNVGTIKEATGTNTAMTIDSSGRILTPANPKFSVYQSVAIASANYTSTATSDVPFDTEEFDVGNCVAISSGAATFTAPVTGYYQFNLMVLMEGTGASTTVSTYLDVNGALVNSASNLSYRNLEDVEGGGYVTLTTSALIYVPATQTVKPKLHVGTDTAVILRAGQRFSGFLVG